MQLQKMLQVFQKQLYSNQFFQNIVFVLEFPVVWFCLAKCQKNR